MAESNSRATLCIPLLSPAHPCIHRLSSQPIQDSESPKIHRCAQVWKESDPHVCPPPNTPLASLQRKPPQGEEVKATDGCLKFPNEAEVNGGRRGVQPRERSGIWAGPWRLFKKGWEVVAICVFILLAKRRCPVNFVTESTKQADFATQPAQVSAEGAGQLEPLSLSSPPPKSSRGFPFHFLPGWEG